MSDIYLQSVVVKKPSSLALARFRSQSIIKNKRKTYFEETDDTFRFRNLPKQYFSDLVTQQINEDISIVVGHLNAKGLGSSDMEPK
jgi:hypothetical protein